MCRIELPDDTLESFSLLLSSKTVSRTWGEKSTTPSLTGEHGESSGGLSKTSGEPESPGGIGGPSDGGVKTGDF